MNHRSVYPVPQHCPYDSWSFCCKRLPVRARTQTGGYATVTGSLAVQFFDILYEYVSGLHASECPSRVASARFRDESS